MNNLIEKTVQILKSNGFIPIFEQTQPSVHGSKEYDCYGKKKQALVSIWEIHGKYYLNFSYYSEGRDILERNCGWLKEETNVQSIINNCEKLINESYLRKLFLAK